VAQTQAVLAVLAEHPGMSQADACIIAGVIPQNFSRWVKAYRSGGPSALEPRYKNCRRPRELVLEPWEVAELQEIYLRTNRTSSSGSMTMAARLYADKNEKVARALGRRKDKHSLPAAIVEACQAVNHLVALHREGARALREATYTPGLMRLSPCRTRRLLGGEQQSWDDATINFGVCVPWPWGGDPCSDRFEVKLGRFQLLLCHDDATSFIPSWTYVIRPAQSYRGAEVGGAILRAARDGIKPSRVVVEGGVWQSKRVLDLFAALGIAWVDAKGRPQCKLVENYFNRLWSKLSATPALGHVGRFRAEMKENSDLYCACQAGRKDPRNHFPMLPDALAAIEQSIAWLNTEHVQGDYGSWVPQERYMNDLADHPREKLHPDWEYLAAPVCEERMIRRGMVECTAEGPFGFNTKWHFAHHEMGRFQNQPVRIYFDPLAEAPVKARVELLATYAGLRKGTILCDAVSIDPLHDGTPTTAKEQNRQLRSMMRRDYTALAVDPQTGHQHVVRRESEARGPGTRTEISRGGKTPGGGEAELSAPRRPDRPATRALDEDELARRCEAEDAEFRRNNPLIPH